MEKLPSGCVYESTMSLKCLINYKIDSFLYDLLYLTDGTTFSWVAQQDFAISQWVQSLRREYNDNDFKLEFHIGLHSFIADPTRGPSGVLDQRSSYSIIWRPLTGPTSTIPLNEEWSYGLKLRLAAASYSTVTEYYQNPFLSIGLIDLNARFIGQTQYIPFFPLIDNDASIWSALALTCVVPSVPTIQVDILGSLDPLSFHSLSNSGVSNIFNDYKQSTLDIYSSTSSLCLFVPSYVSPRYPSSERNISTNVSSVISEYWGSGNNSFFVYEPQNIEWQKVNSNSSILLNSSMTIQIPNTVKSNTKSNNNILMYSHGMYFSFVIRCRVFRR